jgi:hypothetical protein
VLTSNRSATRCTAGTRRPCCSIGMYHPSAPGEHVRRAPRGGTAQIAGRGETAHRDAVRIDVRTAHPAAMRSPDAGSLHGRSVDHGRSDRYTLTGRDTAASIAFFAPLGKEMK